ncbi:hypothetical protein C7S15_6700 [Burkholderia cepacia]|nr:hypothetical protein [Burkholderia cepacia]
MSEQSIRWASLGARFSIKVFAHKYSQYLVGEAPPVVGADERDDRRAGMPACAWARRGERLRPGAAGKRDRQTGRVKPAS